MQNYQMYWPSGPNRFEPNFVNKPQVIGEGDVVSTVSPEGIVQYFFLPISQWMPCVFSPIVKPNYNYFNPTITSWFVRSINSPLPATLSQPYQTQTIAPHVGSCYSQDCNINTYNSGFQLKFHNDKWSSTTDLYYFYPGPCQRDWISAQQKGSAAVQVDMPILTTNICHCQVYCKKLCHCQNNLQQGTKTDLHSCDHGNAESHMSVEDTRIEDNLSNKHCTKKHNKNIKPNRTDVYCDCGKVSTSLVKSNKLVTTFADQQTDCTPEVGRETQTVFKNNSFTNTTATRNSKNKRKKKRKPAEVRFSKSKSSETVISKSECCSGTTTDSCDCHSARE